jgi:hypothetical protein
LHGFTRGHEVRRQKLRSEEIDDFLKTLYKESFVCSPEKAVVIFLKRLFGGCSVLDFLARFVFTREHEIRKQKLRSVEL